VVPCPSLLKMLQNGHPPNAIGMGMGTLGTLTTNFWGPWNWKGTDAPRRRTRERHELQTLIFTPTPISAPPGTTAGRRLEVLVSLANCSRFAWPMLLPCAVTTTLFFLTPPSCFFLFLVCLFVCYSSVFWPVSAYVAFFPAHLLSSCKQLARKKFILFVRLTSQP
jgi:hypothetical protein